MRHARHNTTTYASDGIFPTETLVRFDRKLLPLSKQRGTIGHRPEGLDVLVVFSLPTEPSSVYQERKSLQGCSVLFDIAVGGRRGESSAS